MNSVYHRLRSEFMPDYSYAGADVQAVILKVIKVHFFLHHESTFTDWFLNHLQDIAHEDIAHLWFFIY